MTKDLVNSKIQAKLDPTLCFSKQDTTVIAEVMQSVSPDCGYLKGCPNNTLRQLRSSKSMVFMRRTGQFEMHSNNI